MNEDAFASVWDDPALGRVRAILSTVAATAEGLGIRLFLAYGTLLGHIREGRILRWDDDVDLALFTGEDRYRFVEGLKRTGLSAIFDRWPAERDFPRVDPDGCIKIYDETNQTIGGHFGGRYTWPYLDVFVYTIVDSILYCRSYHDGNVPLARSAVLPGRRVIFEGVTLWEPALPLVVLDTVYPTWRTEEHSSSWNHRLERPTGAAVARRIRTDMHGRLTV